MKADASDLSTALSTLRRLVDNTWIASLALESNPLAECLRWESAVSGLLPSLNAADAAVRHLIPTIEGFGVDPIEVAGVTRPTACELALTIGEMVLFGCAGVAWVDEAPNEGARSIYDSIIADCQPITSKDRAKLLSHIRVELNRLGAVRSMVLPDNQRNRIRSKKGRTGSARRQHRKKAGMPGKQAADTSELLAALPELKALAAMIRETVVASGVGMQTPENVLRVDDDGNYLPASKAAELLPDKTIRALNSLLGDNEWIRRKRPITSKGTPHPQRLIVHAGDLHKYLAMADKADDQALSRIESAASTGDISPEHRRQRDAIPKNQNRKLKRLPSSK